MAKTSVPTYELSESAARICEAALELFLERGFDNTPLSLIAKRLGLAKAGIYHHFQSKEELLYVIHRVHAERDMVPILMRAQAAPDPETCLRVFIAEYTKLLATDPTARLLIAEAKRLTPEHFAEVKRLWRTTFNLVRDSLAALQRSKRIPKKMDPSFAAFAAIGMCSWVSIWYDSAKSSKEKELASTLEQIFFHGVFSMPAE